MRQLLLTFVLACGLAWSSAAGQEKVSEADLDTLVQVVQDKGEALAHRLTACERLRVLGPQAKKAVPALRQCLKEGSSDLALAAVQTLESIGPEAKEAVPEITSFLDGKSITP